MDTTLSPIKNQYINDSGWLEVSGGHKIYWVDWGNKDIKQPIFYIHGGPGGGFSESSFDKFDPRRHRVIFHDQRGAGRSVPFGSTVNNKTSDLISDITLLRETLGFDKISLYGFSWGSTLSLLYAIKHPEAIDTMLIGGIFLANKKDEDYTLRGGVATHFPEVWQQVRSIVPSDTSDEHVIDYYKKAFESDDLKIREKFARQWTIYESSLVRLEYQESKIEPGLENYPYLELTTLEAHYILNGCFIAENYILKNVDKLRQLSRIAIVQGRYDFVCAPQSAHDLYTAINSTNTTIQYVEAGHSPSDPLNRQVIKAYTNSLW